MLRAATFMPTMPASGQLAPLSTRPETWRLRLRDFAHDRLELDADAQVAPGAHADSTLLLIVHAGEVALVPAESATPLLLGEGEIVLVGSGGGWRLELAGAVRGAGRPLRVVELGATPPLVPQPPRAATGVPGARAEVSFIALGFEDDAEAELLRWLPPVALAPGPGRRLPVFTSLLAGADGYDAAFFADPVVFARSLEVVVLDLLRRRPPQPVLVAPGSAAIRKAVELMRADLVATWRVAGLAARVGLSRSAFAARFTLEVGEPPLHHLARLRLRAAATRLLRRRDEPIKSIASSVGYESMPSFCKAFRQLFGVAPGAYRRRGTSLSG